VGKIGAKALLGVIVLVVVGLLIRAGVSKWRASRLARLAVQDPAQDRSHTGLTGGLFGPLPAAA
jgi:hypothetical protein